jgi:hypothetical protein
LTSNAKIPEKKEERATQTGCDFDNIQGCSNSQEPVKLPHDEVRSAVLEPLKRVTSKDLPNRLTNSSYGRQKIESQRKEMAANAPSIEEVWQITERLPSLTKLLLEGRK